MDYEGDDIEEVFCLTFVISISLLGDSKDIELKTNGAEVPVNQKNKQEFVQVPAFLYICNFWHWVKLNRWNTA